mmetsp:Transcript_29368/g.73360  ORF Transcript_29368/g.73360 Transcript_29368/m.73360 type:complete len:305 (+) Transcript_29368:353-1267(+)
MRNSVALSAWKQEQRFQEHTYRKSIELHIIRNELDRFAMSSLLKGSLEEPNDSLTIARVHLLARVLERVAIFVARLQFGTSFQQQLDHVGVAKHRGDDERCATVVSPLLQLRSRFDEELDTRRPAALARGVQRRPPVYSRLVDVHLTLLQQQLDALVLALLARDPQRRELVRLRRLVGEGAGVEQQLRALHVPRLTRGEERRDAVRGARLHERPNRFVGEDRLVAFRGLLQQQVHAFAVPNLARVEQPALWLEHRRTLGFLPDDVGLRRHLVDYLPLARLARLERVLLVLGVSVAGGHHGCFLS